MILIQPPQPKGDPMDAKTFDWAYFHDRILRTARSQLWRKNLGDEDDIAQSTLRSFDRRTRLPDGDPQKEKLLENKNKAWEAIRRHMNNKLKRHQYHVRKPDVAGPRLPSSDEDPLNQLWSVFSAEEDAGRQMEDDEAIEMARKSLIQLVDKLFTDDLTRQVARLCLRGDSQRAVADELQISYHKARKCCESVVGVFQELTDG